MFGGLSIWSWDIRYLYNYSYSPPPPCYGCRDTVTFEGLCVAATELNYMMFGWGIVLCQENMETELNWLELALRLRHWDPPDVIQRKVGFAQYAAGGYPSLPGWLAWPHDCKPTSDKLNEDFHDWRWWGLKGGAHF